MEEEGGDDDGNDPVKGQGEMATLDAIDQRVLFNHLHYFTCTVAFNHQPDFFFPRQILDQIPRQMHWNCSVKSDPTLREAP